MISSLFPAGCYWHSVNGKRSPSTRRPTRVRQGPVHWRRWFRCRDRRELRVRLGAGTRARRRGQPQRIRWHYIRTVRWWRLPRFDHATSWLGADGAGITRGTGRPRLSGWTENRLRPVSHLAKRPVRCSQSWVEAEACQFCCVLLVFRFFGCGIVLLIDFVRKCLNKKI